MIFTILVLLVTIFYLILLELSKNMIVGWCIGIIAMILMLFFRNKLKQNGKQSFKRTAVLWIGFAIVLCVNYILTSPPYRNVPAVDNKNPEVTEVVHINQGDLTGVYN